MTSNNGNKEIFKNRPVLWTFAIFVIIGLGGFLFQLAGQHPERAWQTYLINFLLWSAIAQGGLLFSMVTHITKATWSKPLQRIAESFAAFFPVSFGLFLLLFVGKDHIFPWLHQDLHGKEVWLNLPFLFSRDVLGLLILYGLGLAYLYYALRFRMPHVEPQGRFHRFLHARWSRSTYDPEQCKERMSILSVLYMIAYALVLSLIAFDLVMSMDPHWISTLFGAYSFVKAFYVGLGSLIILAAVIRLKQGEESGLVSSHFHDLGKLFLAFCLAWADFFYCQFIVIWYGNISEETSYIIKRTMISPWNSLAWVVFIVSFIIPFFILLNRSIKTRLNFMIVLCSVVIAGIWLEHLLLLGPALNPGAGGVPLSPVDGFITIGFLGLMALSLICFMRLFPALVLGMKREAI
ncbi:MAG: hypothetical protein PVI20_20770 [Desulfobacteraceae bacterium]|jgi:hypothetical protein